MKTINILIALLIIATSATAEPDKLLGSDFETQTFEMGSDYSGKVRSTLITRSPLLDSDRAILYIHGYNDYFFQAQMADRFRDSGYNFYAIDLRKYGRSYDSSQKRYEVRDLHEYFADIDRALEVIRTEGAREVILMGHSTGGLIASYYCGTQQDTPPVEGLILNSPFLNMNLTPFMESVLIPIVSTIGALFPDLEVSNDNSTAYFDSLHRDSHGEWDFDSDLKLPTGIPTTAGWIRAIHEAHNTVQKGYDLKIPILLMYSDKSLVASEWNPEFQSADTVLDVVDIALYGDRLGSDVTHAQIKDGMHDLVLSGYEAREETYSEIFGWLYENLR